MPVYLCWNFYNSYSRFAFSRDEVEWLQKHGWKCERLPEKREPEALEAARVG